MCGDRGLGFQNQESRIRATPDTPYLIGDLNQTLSAALLLRCTEERRLDLNEPLRRYDDSVADTAATIRQVLSHTSSGSGATYQYDTQLYSQAHTRRRGVHRAALSKDRRGQPPRTPGDEGLRAGTGRRHVRHPERAHYSQRRCSNGNKTSTCPSGGSVQGRQTRPADQDGTPARSHQCGKWPRFNRSKILRGSMRLSTPDCCCVRKRCRWRGPQRRELAEYDAPDRAGLVRPELPRGARRMAFWSGAKRGTRRSSSRSPLLA